MILRQCRAKRTKNATDGARLNTLSCIAHITLKEAQLRLTNERKENESLLLYRTDYSKTKTPGISPIPF